MRPGKLPAATHKLISEPMMGSGLQSPVLVTSAMSSHCPTGNLPTGCASDQRAHEEELDMWMQNIGNTGGQGSSWLIRKHQVSFGCSCLLILLSLPFFFIILCNTAILAADGGRKDNLGPSSSLYKHSPAQEPWHLVDSAALTSQGGSAGSQPTVPHSLWSPSLWAPAPSAPRNEVVGLTPSWPAPPFAHGTLAWGCPAQAPAPGGNVCGQEGWGWGV